MSRCALTAALFVLALSGCQSNPTRPPEYTVHLDGVRRTPEQAQAVLIERTLTLQITPPLDRPLRALSVPLPPYPAEIRRGDAALDGNVRVRFLVGENGAVTAPTVIGTANPVLIEICLATIQRWRFDPPMRAGAPTTVPLTFEFRFKLEP